MWSHRKKMWQNVAVWPKQKLSVIFFSISVSYNSLSSINRVHCIHQKKKKKKEKEEEEETEHIKQEWVWIILPMNIVCDTNMDNIIQVGALDQSDHFECSFDSGHNIDTIFFRKYQQKHIDPNIACVRACTRIYVWSCIEWIFSSVRKRKKGIHNRGTYTYSKQTNKEKLIKFAVQMNEHATIMKKSRYSQAFHYYYDYCYYSPLDSFAFLFCAILHQFFSFNDFPKKEKKQTAQHKCEEKKWKKKWKIIDVANATRYIQFNMCCDLCIWKCSVVMKISLQ